MASLFDLSSDSDSSDDPDFIPSGVDVHESDENVSDVECANGDKSCKPKEKEKKKVTPKRSTSDNESILSSSDSQTSDEEDLTEGEKHKTKKGNRIKNRQENKAEVKNMPVVDEKKRIDDIWQSFLKDVESVPSKMSNGKSNTEEKQIESSSISKDVPMSMQQDPSKEISTDMAEHPKEVPMKFSSKEVVKSESNPNSGNMCDHTVFEFAGETFTVADSLKSSGSDNSSIMNESTTAPAASGGAVNTNPQKRGGLFSVLGTIANKKQKLTTLQKTAMDWKSFKQCEGIDIDLEKFNKGKQGFVERQRFLQRSDVRSFEVEKGIRKVARKK